jgi:V8-like Glu-specific endopeptidase
MIFCAWRISNAVQGNRVIEAHNRAIKAHQAPDTRYRVARPLQKPYEAVVQLVLFQKDGGESKCTGGIIAPKVVLTAKHCLEGTGLVFVASPGDNEDASITFGSVSRSFRMSDNGDYGVIFLPHPLEFTPFRLQEFPHDLSSVELTTAGYPGDKEKHTLWENNYQSFASWKRSENKVFSGGVSYGGQSGSLAFQKKENQFVAMGILVTGTKCDKNSKGECLEVTIFVEFSDVVMKEIRGWIAMSE